MRKQINGLSILVEQGMSLSPLDGALYLFLNAKADILKILYWDKTGFALWQKRLEKDRFFPPRNLAERNIVLTAKQVELLLEGYDLSKLHPHDEINYKKIC
jgi:transposase